MNVAEELRKHAKRVEEMWVRRSPGPGEVCMAFIGAPDDDWAEFAYSDDAYEWVTEHLGTEPADWNDRKPSEGGPVNRRQVAAVLRRAADAWEREQGVSA